MATKIISVDDPGARGVAVRDAAAALRGGAVVAFPTETVYGVGASASFAAKLRGVKGRSDDQPFTVHLGKSADAARYLRASAPVARRLARKAWPGPLTLVCEEPLPAQTEVARQLSEAAATTPQPELHIRGDRAVRYERVAQAMANAQRAGLRKIGFITEPRN